MHPAYSVILFTTASGAGYGLLIWLCLLGALGIIPTPTGLGWVGFGIAFTLITLGLLASTFHLGHPERAWRAMTQWKSSWLSREGVLALLTYLPAGLVALVWVFRGFLPWYAVIFAFVTVILALLTVYCTGMIYRSLRTIRQWDQPTVTLVYIVLSLASGAVLLNFLLFAFGIKTPIVLWIGIFGLLAALFAKMKYWSAIDNAPKKYSTEQATGLGRYGKVRVSEPAHTQENYIMREMGFSVARKHATKLRRIALIAGFVLPLIVLNIALYTGTGFGTVLLLLAVVGVAIGLLVERWLFFAEAQHVVTIYYGADAA